MIRKLAAWLQGVALAIGAPGLFAVAFLDSSFVSLPQITDALVVWMVTVHPYRVLLYAATATAGSVCGCFAIYYVARRGGEAWVRRRFHERHIDRGLDLFQRYGIWALIVPALLPPPAPFKLFVLMSGVAGMSTSRFLVAVVVGRGTRYSIEAMLALWYGRAAIAFLNENLRPVAWAFLVLVGAGVVVLIWRAKRQKL